jgi:septal ring factor EnvC (AmiA/AmiB activator)
VDADPLAGFLKLAQQEGALEGENLEAFLAGLRERAEQVIAERLGRVETKLRVLETENRWQRDAMATLNASVNGLESERAWLRETIANLDAEAARKQATIEDLEEELRKASTAHESLLAHHRELTARFASQLGEIASLSPLRAQEVRRRLRALADLLRADTL